jgi:hypothetical protein
MSTRSTRYYDEELHVFDDCFHDDVGVDVRVKPEDWSYEGGEVTLRISRAAWDAMVAREIELRRIQREAS